MLVIQLNWIECPPPEGLLNHGEQDAQALRSCKLLASHFTSLDLLLPKLGLIRVTNVEFLMR